MADAPVGRTFSDIWYRVERTRPRLSPHARLVRQRHARRVSYIIEDPASGQYFRLSESAWFFAGMLDGRRTVEEAWDACCAQLADDAPTQTECIDVLTRLQMFGLLTGEMPLAPDMVDQRAGLARSARIRKRTGNFTSPSIPLWNPEPLLDRSRHILRGIFSRWGAVAWVALVATGLFAILTRLDAFARELDLGTLLDPRSLVVFAIVFLFLRAVHELGHAAACKAMGGRSTEIGVILIAGLLPLPYCDATSAWRFPELWRRVLVSGAGILAETPIAAVAAMLWAWGDAVANPVVHDVSRQVVLVSGISTLAFNLNPLLRYDGYYILSDVTGIPNLAQRSRDMLKYLMERRIFGVHASVPPPMRSPAEGRFLVLYALVATPYRFFVLFSILLLIAMRYRELGIALGVIVGFAWIVWPLLKGLGYLLTSPRLIGRRGRAIGAVSALILLLALLLGIVPAPAAAYAWGTIEPARSAPLRAQESGFLREVRLTPGDAVREGEPVFVLENPELIRDLRVAEAKVREGRAILSEATAVGPRERRQAEVRLRSLISSLNDLRRRVRALTIRAPIDGRLVAGEGGRVDLENLVGSYAERGTLLAEIADTDDLIVRASVSDRDYAYVFAGDDPPRTSVRIRGRGGQVVPAEVTRVVSAGSRRVHSRALTTPAGGDAVVDPRVGDARATLDVRFPVELRPERPIPGAQPGLRARVRFTAEPRPLAVQWIRRVRQFFSSRLGP